MDEIIYNQKLLETNHPNDSTTISFQISSSLNEPLLSKESKKLRITELANQLNINTKRLTWKIDICVCLPFFLLYVLANLNRSLTGFLVIGNILTDLKISEHQLFIAIGCGYYIPYVMFQSFSNLILKNIRPHFWISISLLSYGAIVFSTSFINTFYGFIILQVFHGLLQSGVDSGIIYVLSNYYDQTNFQKRVSFVLSGAPFAILLNNLIEYGIVVHKADSSMEVWRWLMLVNGAITMGGAILLFFIIPDFPEGNRFMSDEETLFVIKKLEIFNNGMKSGYNISFGFKDVINQLRDPLIWVPIIPSILIGGVCFQFAFVQPYASSFFFGADVLVKAGWPWFTGFFFCIISGFISDWLKSRKRYLILIFCSLLSIYGSAVMSFDHSTDINDMLKFSCEFLLVSGAFSFYPLIVGWMTFNINGHLRRSIITSLMICAYDVGEIYGLFSMLNNNLLFSQSEYLCFTANILALLTCGGYVLWLIKQNKLKRTEEYKKDWSSKTESEQILLGDKNPNFEYFF